MNLIPWHSKQSAGDGAGGTGGAGDAMDVRRELARAMDRFFDEPTLGARGLLDPSRLGGVGGGFMPAVDVTEDDKEVVVTAEIPGIDPENVDVSISGHALILSGQKEESREDRGKDYSRSERTFGSFRRRIELPESVDVDRVSAEYGNGVLSVRAPKQQGVGTKKIPISASGKPGAGGGVGGRLGGG